MNDQIPIEVKCRSGYKADEYPVMFYWDGVRFEIEEIIDRWYQGENNPEFPAANYYKVRTTNFKNFLLKHELKADRWFLLVLGETITY